MSAPTQAGFKKTSSHVYFRNEDSSCAEFFWFLEHKPHDFLLGINGLSGGASTLLCEYPDEETEGGPALVFKRTFRYIDAKPVNELFDHFSFHPIEMNFSLKLRSPLGRIHKLQFSRPVTNDTSAYQDVVIMSDLRMKYTSRVKQEINSQSFLIPPNAIFINRMRLAGIDYDLETEVKKNDGISGALPSDKYSFWHGSTLKAIFKHEARLVKDPNIFCSRPPGTVVSFLLPPLATSNSPTRWLTKGFHFQ